MSRKTEPRFPDIKYVECSNCGGTGTIGMYHEVCDYCRDKRNLTQPPKSGK